MARADGAESQPPDRLLGVRLRADAAVAPRLDAGEPPVDVRAVFGGALLLEGGKEEELLLAGESDLALGHLDLGMGAQAGHLDEEVRVDPREHPARESGGTTEHAAVLGEALAEEVHGRHWQLEELRHHLVDRERARDLHEDDADRGVVLREELRREQAQGSGLALAWNELHLQRLEVQLRERVRHGLVLHELGRELGNETEQYLLDLLALCSAERTATIAPSLGPGFRLS